MTDDLVTEARRLDDAATPGPWPPGAIYSGPGDPEFIARARTLVPELADLAERDAVLRARLAVLSRRLDAAWSHVVAHLRIVANNPAAAVLVAEVTAIVSLLPLLLDDPSDETLRAVSALIKDAVTGASPAPPVRNPWTLDPHSSS